LDQKNYLWDYRRLKVLKEMLPTASQKSKFDTKVTVLVDLG